MIYLTKNVTAFTLIEVLAAIVIIGLITGPILGLFSQGLNSVETSSNYNEAMLLAKGEMEFLTSLSYSQLQNYQDIQLQPASPYVMGLEVGPSQYPDILLIELTVTWETMGPKREYILTNLRSKR